MKTSFKPLILVCSILFLTACQVEDNSDKTDIREDFVGSWKCVQKSKIISSSEFTVTITKDSTNASRIKLTNFYKLGSEGVYANVSTVNAEVLDIPVQYVQDNTIKGSGTQTTSTKINFDYTVDDGNEVDTLTAVFTKL